MRRLLRMAVGTMALSCLAVFGCTKADEAGDSSAPTDVTEPGDTLEPDPQPGHRDSLYRTTYPMGRGNLNNTKAVVNAGLPRGVTADQIGIELFEMPFPTSLITGDDDEIFVWGGASLIIENLLDEVDGQPADSNDVSPHLTRVTISTGEQTTIALDRGVGWAYLGGAILHANGFVYAVSQAHLYKIDRKAMEIVASIDLPMANLTTIYNGIVVSRTGELILKSIGRDFVDLRLLLIDPGTLEIVLDKPCDCGSARLSLAVNEAGEEHIYHINRQEVFRYLVEPGALTLDENWIAAYDPYGTGGENEEPTSPLIVAGKAHFTTNTNPKDVTEPMRVFWHDIDKPYTRDMPALPGPLLFGEGIDSAGFSFGGLAADDATGILIGNDQGNGLFNAYLPQEDGSIEILWQKEVRNSAHTSIVSDREMVYTSDYVDGSNHLVAFDLKTGEELLRIPTPATRATFSVVAHTSSNETFLVSPESGKPTGFVVRFYVRDGE